MLVALCVVSLLADTDKLAVVLGGRLHIASPGAQPRLATEVEKASWRVLESNSKAHEAPLERFTSPDGRWSWVRSERQVGNLGSFQLQDAQNRANSYYLSSSNDSEWFEDAHLNEVFWSKDSQSFVVESWQGNGTQYWTRALYDFAGKRFPFNGFPNPFGNRAVFFVPGSLAESSGDDPGVVYLYSRVGKVTERVAPMRISDQPTDLRTWKHKSSPSIPVVYKSKAISVFAKVIYSKSGKYFAFATNEGYFWGDLNKGKCELIRGGSSGHWLTL